MKSELLIEDVAKRLGIKGSKNKYSCPLHEDSDPSLILYNPNYGHCLGCNEKFNSVTLVAATLDEVKNNIYKLEKLISR